MLSLWAAIAVAFTPVGPVPKPAPMAPPEPVLVLPAPSPIPPNPKWPYAACVVTKAPPHQVVCYAPAGDRSVIS